MDMCVLPPVAAGKLLMGADCYLFDRHISLRTGRAFWSRGPSLCFRGYSDLLQSGPAAAKLNFPILAAGGDPNDDSASIVQACE